MFLHPTSSAPVSPWNSKLGADRNISALELPLTRLVVDTGHFLAGLHFLRISNRNENAFLLESVIISYSSLLLSF